MVKVKIGTKLFITYFILLLITFTIISASFNLLSQKYLIKETKEQLKKEGKLISDTLKQVPFSNADIKETILARRALKVAGRYVDSKIIVFNNKYRIIYTNLDINNRKLILSILRKNQENSNEYVVEKIPVYTHNNKELKGYVILLAKVKDIKELNIIFRRTQFLSFVIAGIIALIIAYLFQKSLTKPIKLLMNKMTGFSIKKYKKDLNINTGDEIEELAHCFNKMADELKKYDDQQKSFLQNTSHELKTPLMSIQGYAEAIKDGIVEGKEMEDSLNIIIEESQRLKKVVEQIIYLTKLENVEETFEFKDENLDKIISKAIKAVKPLAEEKKVVINTTGILNVVGKFDEEKMIRAFINVLGNCIRYAQTEINIEVKNKGELLEINISDDGPGFKKGEEKRIFDRFYKKDSQGTGIGLAITKAIIEGHKGTITAINNTPNGALFKIFLPL